MTVTLVLAAVLFGLLFGIAVGLFAYNALVARSRRRQAKSLLGQGSVLEAASVSLEVTGINAWVIEKAVDLSSRETVIQGSLKRIASYGFSKNADLLAKSGLEHAVSEDGFAAARADFLLKGTLIGAFAGLAFSSFLMVIGALIGFLWGWTVLERAMKEESRCRAFSAERQFSQMVEVVVLGLRSGMSFDKSLSLYCGSFNGSLSAVAGLALKQWSHSLIDRSEGLRQIARSYDSVLFDRFAENVIRSLRFGTSMSESLGLLAVEARAVRKAKLEEKVAKAPVKMLLPVGTLILPAMLILVMGPIMLDLMNGF